ncbi:hypothetical protein [Cryobacterium tagatosivorans]|uniref:Uncharacterized protein n=1 Tax=Cryobacterium tagatosivorans TaxID=1259199 RepID=A0A4R8UKB1_9MICO|nr:hypothetical protein [Cryobacterium tagatosivorans]TFB56687.1 hypothetical protein E3O23_00240 [Cryobacterium tagatosivorans]
MFQDRDLLELKWYTGKSEPVLHPTAKSLTALAYLDYFPTAHETGVGLRSIVSGAVLGAKTGWCGTFGPGVADIVGLLEGGFEGNYDMTQMHLLAMAYSYYPDLSPDARERLIVLLLARGRMKRPELLDTFTSGIPPDDWDLAGHVGLLEKSINIGETENHILMIATARYLTNQLLFQRDGTVEHDNRRNSNSAGQTCLSILLSLFRRILQCDFSEYNAKPYQTESRWALVNLCTYAYDHEVRLGARMVLDYVAAHIAVSSNDLRRMVPFRRLNEGLNVDTDEGGTMTIGLLEQGDFRRGADPMSTYFALQAGNTRAYESIDGTTCGWPKGDSKLAIEALSDYRLPAPIHDLFVNDLHRRYFQRLHRTPRKREQGDGRNSDEMEIYAGSPSYLITAGGSPSGYAIDPDIAGKAQPDGQRQQLGVAVTTSFMPTGAGGGAYPEGYASSIIQFSSFAELGIEKDKVLGVKVPLWHLKDDPARNYGVAPDFACGHRVYWPSWVEAATDSQIEKRVPEVAGSGFRFVNRSSSPGQPGGPGFFLATFEAANGFALLEALDTWLHPGVTLEAFAADVVRRNPAIELRDNEPFTYTTRNGNRLDVVIWSKRQTRGFNRGSIFGAQIFPISYGNGDPLDAVGDAGKPQQGLLHGTIMNSPRDAVVEIANSFRRTTITLDMTDAAHPRRTSETGEVEIAGPDSEVWLDFEWKGKSEGDVCRPFNSLAAAIAAVRDAGTVRLVPGATTERSTLGAGGKRVNLIAPIGGVVLGGATTEHPPTANEGSTVDVREADVWVQFDLPDTALDGPVNTLTQAAAAVPDGAVVWIVPGIGGDRPTLGASHKRFSIRAPLGGVVIGRGIWA